LRASVVQSAHKSCAVDQIVLRPRIARTATIPAAARGETDTPLTLEEGKILAEGAVDIWSISGFHNKHPTQLRVKQDTDAGNYLALRRALMRFRADARKAPAEPTRARTSVGFSGEFTQPSCACKGSETASRTAEPISRSEDFFMVVPQVENNVQAKCCQSIAATANERVVQVGPALELQLLENLLTSQSMAFVGAKMCVFAKLSACEHPQLPVRGRHLPNPQNLLCMSGKPRV
jgi:hypothetical protein